MVNTVKKIMNQAKLSAKYVFKIASKRSIYKQQKQLVTL